MKKSVLILCLVCLSGCLTLAPQIEDKITPIRHRELTARVVEHVTIEICILQDGAVFVEKKDIYGMLVISPDLVQPEAKKNVTLGPTIGRRIAFVEAGGIAMRAVSNKLVDAVVTDEAGVEKRKQIDIGGLYLRATKTDAEPVDALIKRNPKGK